MPSMHGAGSDLPKSEESYHKHVTIIMLVQLFIDPGKIHLYEQEKLSMATQDVILSLKSTLIT
jgi:hypothetical protein